MDSDRGWSDTIRFGWLAALVACVLAVGCAEVVPPSWPWDPDGPVLPLRERADSTASAGGLPRSIVVLLPDEAGLVGAVEVTSEKGVKTLSRAHEAVALEDPASPVEISEEQIRQAFGAALAAEPEPPTGFVIYFELDSAEFIPESRQQWPGILSAIADRSASEVSIAGHTDRSGGTAHNDKLSRRRAEKVLEGILGAGVDLELIEISWHSESRPVVPTADGVRESRNRRVEIRVR